MLWSFNDIDGCRNQQILHLCDLYFIATQQKLLQLNNHCPSFWHKRFFWLFKFSTAKKHCGIYQIRTKAETSVPGAKNRD